MKIVGVVQARVGSTRLPRKIMKTLPYGGGREESMLRFLLDRLTRSHYLDLIVVACPESDFRDIINEGYIADDPTPVDFRHYPVPDDDLVARHAAVARAFDADLIVRVPSDNPFVDPFLVDLTIWSTLAFRRNRMQDSLAQLCPGGKLDGLGGEVYPRAVIEALDATATEREHPRTALAAGGYEVDTFVERDWRHGPMTFDVNTQADLERMRRIAAFCVEEWGPHFSARNLNSCSHEVFA